MKKAPNDTDNRHSLIITVESKNTGKLRFHLFRNFNLKIQTLRTDLTY